MFIVRNAFDISFTDNIASSQIFVQVPILGN